jgi:cGMP-dependent protein kinase
MPAIWGLFNKGFSCVRFILTLLSLDYDVCVSANSCVMEANWEDITRTFDDIDVDEKKLFGFMIRLSHVKKISIFKNLQDSRLIELCKRMKKFEYKKDHIIFGEGSDGDYLYLLYKGRVQAFKEGRLLRDIEEKNCFGETSLILNEKHSATIKAVENSSILVLSKNDLFDLLDSNMLDHLIKKISLQDDFLVNLEDLRYIKNLGQGKFGYVSLAQNGKNVFAVKAVSKKSIEKQKILINYLKNERSILLSLDHQFIVKLVKTMKNDNFIFFLMEYVNGVSFGNYLNKKTKLRSKEETQFYIGTLLLVVDYLNSKKIAHRDIKPDNIMIDEKGYLKLIDFGTAVVLKDVTYTIVGTPHYMAPEVLLGKGYKFSADYWSIGIVAYEVYFGKCPFGAGAVDPMNVYKETLKNNLEIPNSTDTSFKNFLKCILKKKPAERVTSLSVFKSNSFFGNFSFVSLLFNTE